MSRGRVLVTTDAVGGVWRYTMDLVRGLGALDVDCVIAVLGPAPSAADLTEARRLAPVMETGLALDWMAEDEGTLRRAAESLADIARRAEAGLVHLHAPAFCGFGHWPVPVVAVAHSCLATWWRAVRGTPLPEDFAWRVAATGRGLRAVDAVIAPSRAFAAALQAAYGAREIAVVHNGGTPTRMAERARQPAVLTAGRLWDEGKNVALLDRVAGRIAAPVLAAGPVAGPNGAVIELHRARRLGTLDGVALRQLYAATSVYAAPARYEPFGLGVLEAAQAGMALVLSDIPTFRELWDGAALFLEPDDDDGWVRALAASVGDQAAVARLAARARERAARYTVEAMAAGTAAVHRSVWPRAEELASVA